MRVAQLTFNAYNNYGNILQKYALQQTLKKFADFTEVLWFNGNSGSSHFWAETAEIPANKSLEHYLRAAVQLSKFKEFDERYIKTRFNISYIEEVADEYDFFVMGSDQVWNPKVEPALMPFPIKFLSFVPSEKKIAYAASIALKDIPNEFKEIYRQGISSFPHISVREENSVDIIKNLIGRKVETLLDPVFLLTPDEWKKVSRRPSWFNEKYSRGYILTYFWGNVQFEFIENLSKTLNLPVIRLLNDKIFNYYSCGPEEFLYLFAHATVVFTESFHGTAFSTIFKVPFIDLMRPGTDHDMTVERMISLTKMFNLENKLATSRNNFKIDSPLEIDYSTRDKVLPLEREKAFNFLATALNSKGGVAQ
ncbi:MAG: polysaccharide pyruvyl transferase family protein [Selenomonadaceae bacterium]|nr:polysaccharide pyruvyl transferase family protein [Selenomonadaceae bacterium]